MVMKALLTCKWVETVVYPQLRELEVRLYEGLVHGVHGVSDLGVMGAKRIAGVFMCVPVASMCVVSYGEFGMAQLPPNPNPPE